MVYRPKFLSKQYFFVRKLCPGKEVASLSLVVTEVSRGSGMRWWRREVGMQISWKKDLERLLRVYSQPTISTAVGSQPCRLLQSMSNYEARSRLPRTKSRPIYGIINTFKRWNDDDNIGKPAPGQNSAFWILLERRMNEMMMTTGAIKTCKAPVKSLPPTYQHPAFYRPDVQPTVSDHWRQTFEHWKYKKKPELKIFLATFVPPNNSV